MSQSKNAYIKRCNSTSIPAPLEVDSDSDFAPGVFVPEPTKKKKKARTSPAGPAKKKRRLDVLEKSPKPEKRDRNSRSEGSTQHNPLREYFEDLDLHSASEDEEALDSTEEHEPKAMGSGSEDDDVPVGLKTWTGFVRQTSAKASNSPGSSRVNSDSSSTDPDSETESDSDVDAPPARNINLVRARHLSRVSLALNTTQPDASNSETESDSEAELDIDPRLKPRPGFPLRPGQVPARALVLDAEKGIKIPAPINTYLRDYQRDGVKFLWRQYSEGRGGLLGDDMGLIISFLSAIMKKQGIVTDRNRRRKHVSKLQDRKAWRERKELPLANATWPTCLIIAPSTVVHNWEREFKTWGYFEVGMYNGTPTEREAVLHDFKMGRFDVVLTSFDLARREIDALDTLPWSCIIVDEVHRVKNETAKITLAYHQFNCLRRFGLTGTTIQNSYKEMWTILDWTNPDRLGTSRQWHGFIVKPLTTGQSAGATEEERAKALVVAVVLRDKLLPNFFLRRTKDIIKDQLPQKTDQVVFCPLTERQVAAYKHLLSTPSLQNLIHRDDPCSCGSPKLSKNCCHPFVVGDVFRFMSILIKLSNHLGLILPGAQMQCDTARNRKLAEMAFPEGNIPKYGTAMMQPKYCGKWAALEVLLKEWRKDHTNKVLIFTKSVKLLDMLEFHLSSKSYGFLKLEGGTKQTDRMPMIDKFNNSPDVFIFLISTLAGGTGLNLTGANKVVIFDPAHDLQAMDRAFRFGQTRDVSVYRLLGAGSVEELIYARQIYKQQQMAIGYEASVQTRYFEGIQGDNAKKGELFGINNIFKLHEDKLATKMAIEKANLAELDWALANMDGQRARKGVKPSNELVEADAKVVNSKEELNLKGLGALLFDDAPPSALPRREQDMIQKTLNAIGVTYSHMNDDILVPSRIEEERTKQSLIKTRRRKSQAKEKGNGALPTVEWPPKRNHHKQPPKPADQLASRHQALVQLGMINSPSDVPAFARDFARQSEEAQRKILAELDRWAEMQVDSDDSDSDSD
ncbi:hypothetical protein BYT27DRAFT_7228846 [Phlegmacium glaucopus]|nr:hypothetical protein BYT27DRAFT_7228846 [Phlegmacium glaucopus]